MPIGMPVNSGFRKVLHSACLLTILYPSSGPKPLPIRRWFRYEKLLGGEQSGPLGDHATPLSRAAAQGRDAQSPVGFWGIFRSGIHAFCRAADWPLQRVHPESGRFVPPCVLPEARKEKGILPRTGYPKGGGRVRRGMPHDTANLQRVPPRP